MPITLIYPAPDSGWAGQRLDDILKRSLAGREGQTISRAEELDGLQGRRGIFALPLGDTGVNVEYVRMLARLRKEPGLLEGCTGGLIVDGAGELFTKPAAADLLGICSARSNAGQTVTRVNNLNGKLRRNHNFHRCTPLSLINSAKNCQPARCRSSYTVIKPYHICLR